MNKVRVGVRYIAVPDGEVSVTKLRQKLFEEECDLLDSTDATSTQVVADYNQLAVYGLRDETEEEASLRVEEAQKAGEMQLKYLEEQIARIKKQLEELL